MSTANRNKMPSASDLPPTIAAAMHESNADWIETLEADLVRLRGELEAAQREMASQANRADGLTMLSSSLLRRAEKAEAALAALRDGCRDGADFDKERDSCHGTFNGGWETPETRRAFHHGMDTAFNVFAGYATRLRALADGKGET